MEYAYKLGFIGGGNMARAIASGVTNNNLLPINEILISDPYAKGDICGIETIGDNSAVLDKCEYVLLAIKPQIFDTLMPHFNAKRWNARVIISIMAGVPSSKITACFEGAKVVRVMPNMPCSLGQGMTAIAENNAGSAANDFVKAVFDAIGTTRVVDEELFDAVTSVSGSGSAYVYYFINAMIEGGIAGGLDAESAKLLTLQTFKGAVAMVENSIEPIDVLIDRVCSKGGTTIEAIKSFDTDGVDTAIKRGVDKCRERSAQLRRGI